MVSFEVQGLPPHSVEAEMSTLGAMLLSEPGCLEVRSIVVADDFYRPVHKTLFTVMCELVDKRFPLDLVTVPNRLAELGKLEEAGGLEYLIAVAEAVPSAHNAAYYAQIVKDLAKLRWMQLHARETWRVSNDPEIEPDAKIAWVLSDALSGQTGESLTGDPAQVAKSILREDYEPWGVDTGFEEIDSRTKQRGLGAALFHVFAAQPGNGKTTMLCQMALNSCLAGHRIAFATLEMSKEEIFRKMVQQMSGYWSRAKAFKNHEEAKFDEAAATLGRCGPWFWDPSDQPEGGAGIENFMAWLLSNHAQSPFKAVYVDYAQLFDVQGRFGEDRFKHIRIAGTLRRMAKRVRVPMFVACQATSHEGKLKISDSQQYWRDAATVVYVTKESLIVDKNRYGPGSFDVPFRFDKDRELFWPLSLDPYGSEPAPHWAGLD